ncbi:hypothetical protein LDL32_16895 [Komagataeibacter sp. FNDCF1]|nr:hypothetical protein [Komagataeibacter sp. FNDCF1]MCE2566275.1 hypothetical protein [Komagataeibacter sp. FNDCF1]
MAPQHLVDGECPGGQTALRAVNMRGFPKLGASAGFQVIAWLVIGAGVLKGLKRGGRFAADHLVER